MWKGTIIHKIIITSLLESTAESMLDKRTYKIQTKLHRSYRVVTIYGHFTLRSIHFEPIFMLYRIQNPKKIV